MLHTQATLKKHHMDSDEKLHGLTWSEAMKCFSAYRTRISGCILYPTLLPNSKQKCNAFLLHTQANP